MSAGLSQEALPTCRRKLADQRGERNETDCSNALPSGQILADKEGIPTSKHLHSDLQDEASMEEL